MQIQGLSWYPGHMTKTKRMIVAEMGHMDAVCEILDARIPLSSRNPDVDEMTAGKPRLIVLNRLLTLISHENMRKEYRLAILSQKGLRERILTYLSMQSARLGKTTFSSPFSREELAAFLCVNRSALSHELSLMEREGLIQFRKNVFTLLYPAVST